MLISGEVVIRTGSTGFVLEKSLSKPTFSIMVSARSTLSFTPEIGFNLIGKN